LPICLEPGCGKPVIAGSDFCKTHSLNTRVIRYVKRSPATKKAAKKALKKTARKKK
jgi:hypothetical protein